MVIEHCHSNHLISILSSLDLLIAEVLAIVLVYSIFMCFFFLIYKVLTDIQTPGSQFDYMVIEHCQNNHLIPISAL